MNGWIFFDTVKASFQIKFRISVSLQVLSISVPRILPKFYTKVVHLRAQGRWIPFHDFGSLSMFAFQIRFRVIGF